MTIQTKIAMILFLAGTLTLPSVSFAQVGQLDQSIGNVQGGINNAMSNSGLGGGNPSLGQAGGVGGSGSESAGSESGASIGVVETPAPSAPSHGCFAPGTLVRMADGGFKPMEAIVVGDMVLSWDVAAGKAVSAQVTKTYTVQRDESYLINGDLRATPEHPFYTALTGDKKQDTLTVEALEAGSLIMALAGEADQLRQVAVESLEQVPGESAFHNITVDGVHDFFVRSGNSWLLVANKSKK